jgi:hypothetical protein
MYPDDLYDLDSGPPAELLMPSPAELHQRAEDRRNLAEISEVMFNRIAARNSPRGPFAANRRGYDAPARPASNFPNSAARPVTVPAVRKVRRRAVATHPVMLEAADWQALQSMGYDRLHVAHHGVAVGTGNRSVAKLIACAGNHEQVVFRDGDSFNLCRSNLVVIPRSLHYRATGHYPQLLSDGRMTMIYASGRTRTKPEKWGLNPQQRLAAILHPAEPILPAKHGPCGVRRAP